MLFLVWLYVIFWFDVYLTFGSIKHRFFQNLPFKYLNLLFTTLPFFADGVENPVSAAPREQTSQVPGPSIPAVVSGALLWVGHSPCYFRSPRIDMAPDLSWCPGGSVAYRPKHYMLRPGRPPTADRSDSQQYLLDRLSNLYKKKIEVSVVILK